ncbi:thiamine phosphate synthase [Planctomycetes bacterium Pla163]
MPTTIDRAAARARERLPHARLMGIFTPELLPEGEALERLLAAAPELDLVQVRVKSPGRRSGPAPARALLEWCERALDALDSIPDPCPLIVNDRPDVARALAGRCAGVHVGQDDTPSSLVRRVLGREPVIGLSTHDAAQVVLACEEPAVDYLGFGPIFATATKGYERGLGPERAWSAAAGADQLPLFPIGGIEICNALELDRVGRAAVGAAVFAADDPRSAARELRHLLGT